MSQRQVQSEEQVSKAKVVLPGEWAKELAGMGLSAAKPTPDSDLSLPHQELCPRGTHAQTLSLHQLTCVPGARECFLGGRAMAKVVRTF